MQEGRGFIDDIVRGADHLFFGDIDAHLVGLFLGIGANERAPDHSTLTLFKNRLIQNGGVKVYEELFDEIIKVAQEKGVKFGKLQIVDSVPLVADVNITKDRKRQKDGKPPHDKDAHWGAKGDKVVETAHGPERKIEYFYGYKDQVSFNAETGLVTSVIPGHARDYDGRQFQKLVAKDLKKGLGGGRAICGTSPPLRFFVILQPKESSE